MIGNEKEMLSKKVWAVVGVTDKKERFGYKIWDVLRRSGYTVYGVHPSLKELDGEKIYPSLSHLPQVPEVVNMVVNPEIAVKILKEAGELGVENVYFQPGSFTPDTLTLADDLGMNRVTACVYAALS